jgi:hypothetical protein
LSIPIVRKEMRWLKRKKAYFQTESDGALTEEEHKELVSYVVIEYLVELIKFEAHRQGRRRSETAEQTARLPRASSSSPMGRSRSKARRPCSTYQR